MSKPRPPRRKLPRWKRLLFAAVTAVLVLAVLEGVSAVVLQFALGTDIDEMHYEQDLLAMTGIAREQAGNVAHPYLGWVHSPQGNPVEFNGRRFPVNQFGFADDKSPLQKRGRDRVVIGVFGGSVAWQFSVLGERVLTDELRESPKFQGKKIVVVRLAISGHKQPQQLQTLAYLLSLGAEFDYVVNIDGFNEVALTETENTSRLMFYAYPAYWQVRSVDLVDPRLSSTAFAVLEVRAARQKWARRMQRFPLRHSRLLNLVWALCDRGYRKTLTELGGELMAARVERGDAYVKTGPQLNPASLDEYRQATAALWRRSSEQMRGLCEANGIVYLHFLQPNQHVKGSKRIGDEERRAMLHDVMSDDYATAVENGYPLLIAEGRELRRTGVRFLDLTMLFAGMREPIYADRCCHYNQRGNDLLARAVAEAMKAAGGK